MYLQITMQVFFVAVVIIVRSSHRQKGGNVSYHMYMYMCIWIHISLVHCRRRIKQNICQSFPALSQDELDQVLPGKATMSTISIITHSGSTIFVYVVDGEPLMFEQESVLHPSGKPLPHPVSLSPHAQSRSVPQSRQMNHKQLIVAK